MMIMSPAEIAKTNSGTSYGLTVLSIRNEHFKFGDENPPLRDEFRAEMMSAFLYQRV
jgi:hypothetical protein